MGRVTTIGATDPLKFWLMKHGKFIVRPQRRVLPNLRWKGFWGFMILLCKVDKLIDKFKSNKQP